MWLELEPVMGFHAQGKWTGVCTYWDYAIGEIVLWYSFGRYTKKADLPITGLHIVSLILPFPAFSALVLLPVALCLCMTFKDKLQNHVLAGFSANVRCIVVWRLGLVAISDWWMQLQLAFIFTSICVFIFKFNSNQYYRFMIILQLAFVFRSSLWFMTPACLPLFVQSHASMRSTFQLWLGWVLIT
jgi:hypothetical protein